MANPREKDCGERRKLRSGPTYSRRPKLAWRSGLATLYAAYRAASTDSREENLCAFNACKGTLRRLKYHAASAQHNPAARRNRHAWGPGALQRAHDYSEVWTSFGHCEGQTVLF